MVQASVAPASVHLKRTRQKCCFFCLSFFRYFRFVHYFVRVPLPAQRVSIKRVGLSLSAPTKGMEMRSNNYRIDDALI